MNENPHAPSFAKPFIKILEFFDRIFDWAYTSAYNPLYRSGVVASGCLAIVIVTGLYLLFFYKISAPFESVVQIENAIWFGSLIRAVHRYASDLTVVAVAFHMLRMLAQGRTWGPRFLAWISGVFMLAILFLSAWTGFVMVWDRHGQRLAIAGASMVDSVGLLSEPLSRAFSGTSLVQSSFFFMNLFLHVALPLGMIVALWIHTSKLARPGWLPAKPILRGIIVLLSVLGFLWPAPLASPPNLFRFEGLEPTDHFYNFWVWGSAPSKPGWLLVAWLSFFTFVLSMTFWWRPSKKPLKSSHDQKKCEGCKQCAEDCPFEAITMVNRTEGTGSPLVAMVNEDLCVACGLCSGSCSQLAIGPADKNARIQLENIRSFKSKEVVKGRMAVLACGANIPVESILVWARAKSISAELIKYDCLGNVHPAVVQTLLLSFDGVFALSCPADLCCNREGTQLFYKRILGGQNPAHPEKLPAARIRFVSASATDLSRVLLELSRFHEMLLNSKQQLSTLPETPKTQWAKGLAASFLLAAFLGFGTRVPVGNVVNHSLLRLSWKFPRQTEKTCRPLTAVEIAKLPFHMRHTEECTVESIDYNLKVTLDDQVIIDKTVLSKGARHDRPLFVDETKIMNSGSHKLGLLFAPIKGEGLKFKEVFSINSKPSEIQVVTLDPSTGFKLLDH